MDVDELVNLKLCHEIHTSERRSFRGCRRRWDWISRERYYPLVTAKPLEFGVAYHKGMEVYYDPNTWLWDRDIIAAQSVLAFNKVCEEQKEAALKARDQLYLDADVEEDYNERVELGVGMLKYYHEKVAPVLDKGWKPVKVEIAFRVLIPNPETGEKVILCKCDECWEKYYKYVDNVLEKGSKGWIPLNEQPGEREFHWNGLPVVYAGRLDMLAEDENGNYWIFDWKTAANISDKTDFLYLDDQIGSYVWALRKIGLNIRGFVYHEQCKGFPQPPKQNKARRLGCLFSVAKNQDVDYETYLATIQAEDAEAYADGSYDAMLAYLLAEGITFYARHQVPKSATEIKSIEYNIGLEALDMLDTNLRIYPSAGRFGCNYCAFKEPCMEKNAGGDYQYALDTLFERREHYYVRQEPSTESKGGE